jgi:glycosyltransferase involved in cell wall biosynthesis
MKKIKLLRITTVPISLKILLKDQLKFMNQYFNVIGVSSQDKEMSDVEKDEGIKTIELNMSREITPFKDLLSLIKMIFLLVKEKPEIVHTHTPKAGIVGMLASWITRVPHRLHTVAGLPVMESTGKKKKILLAVEKLTYACATKVYPNSYGLQEYIVNNMLTDKKKLKIIGYGSSNGIDTEYFQKNKEVLDQAKQIQDKYKIKDKFVFCFVGRVVKDKGINELMYAFDKLSQKYKSISLFIVGQLEDKLDPISTSSHTILNNNNQIKYVGFQSDIRPYLAASDCFVLPTYREGFPNVVLQACSMELPCIVTDINGCNEIIEHHKNGLIVEPKNENELYNAMHKIIEEEELSTQLSLNNRNDIIKKYDRKVFHQYLLEEYNKVLEND